MKKDYDIFDIIKSIMVTDGVTVKPIASDFNPDASGCIRVDEALYDEISRKIGFVSKIADTRKQECEAYEITYTKGLSDVFESGFCDTLAPLYRDTEELNRHLREFNDDMKLAHMMMDDFINAMLIASEHHYIDVIEGNYRADRVLVNLVRKYVLVDVCARMKAEDDRLHEIQGLMEHNISNSAQRQIYGSLFQDIILVSAERMNRCYRKLLGIIDGNSVKEKAGRLHEYIETVAEYWYALYIYSLAESMEPVLIRNCNTKYISAVKEDISGKTNQFRKIAGEFSDCASACSESRGCIDVSCFMDMTPFETRVNELEMFEMLFNGPTGIVCCHGNFYLSSIKPESR